MVWSFSLKSDFFNQNYLFYSRTHEGSGHRISFKVKEEQSISKTLTEALKKGQSSSQQKPTRNWRTQLERKLKKRVSDQTPSLLCTSKGSLGNFTHCKSRFSLKDLMEKVTFIKRTQKGELGNVGPKDEKCFKCQEFGHVAKNCTSLYNKSGLCRKAEGYDILPNSSKRSSTVNA